MRLSIREFGFQIDGDVVEECLTAAIADYWFRTQSDHPLKHILWNGERKFGYMSDGCVWVIFGYVPGSIIKDASRLLCNRDGRDYPATRVTVLRYIAELKQRSAFLLDQRAA